MVVAPLRRSLLKPKISQILAQENIWLQFLEQISSKTWRSVRQFCQQNQTKLNMFSKYIKSENIPIKVVLNMKYANEEHFNNVLGITG